MTAKLNYAVFETEAGWVAVAASAGGLRHVILPQQSPQEVMALLRVAGSRKRTELVPSLPGSSQLWFVAQQLRRYLAGDPVTFSVALDLTGASPFQRLVWETTQSIPYGQTRSYGWLASVIGKAGASRAVGRALARNPVPPIVPCHRVLRSDGNLGGFSAGVDMKRLLLRLEGHGGPMPSPPEAHPVPLSPAACAAFPRCS